ncbi:lactate permease [Vibrio sp. MACH09]|uniref:L-lactate permease n=1 Tax=Vibrio sp. MACH09 TaxID=3025122 RepID=UPI00278F7695|nr:L-lactate permease [Vibrio sp. MACH09]GLO60550.1 lactate permease [Vibrio sp. MACH09]
MYQEYTLFLLSTLPILVITILLVGLRWPAKIVMPLALLSVIIPSSLVWKVPLNILLAQIIDGIFTAGGILYIVFGALILLNTLKETGALTVIKRMFTNISTDRRVQVIIILWLFGAFLEGSAGFGSTGAIIGPLLLGLGFPAMAAAVLCMIFQSTAVSFGAVGTPVLVGLSVGLGSGELEGVGTIGLSWDAYIHQLGYYVAAINGAVAVLMPLILVCMLTRFFGAERSFLPGLRVWKFAIFAGVCFSVPYYLTARYLGPEFPDIIGSLVGLVPVVIAAKKGWLLPNDAGWDFPEKSQWADSWKGVITIEEKAFTSNMSTFKAVLPYLLMVTILFASRMDELPVKAWLLSFTVETGELFGSQISPSLELGYLPGTIFIISALFAVMIHRGTVGTFSNAISSSAPVVTSAFTALMFAVPMVKIFIGSGMGDSELLDMPRILAQFFADRFSDVWIIMSAGIGAMGAFIAGSNTLCNMMFSLFQYNVAEMSGLDTTWIVAVQSVGAAAGNMICVQNVVMITAAVGLSGCEGDIIRKTILPAIYYVLGAAAVAYIALYGIGFHFGTYYLLTVVLNVITGIYKSRHHRDECG